MTESLEPGLSVDASASILCVDDEPSILSALRRLFRAKGLAVQVAQSGPAALALMQTQNFDLVISDMRMPEMDGVAFLEQVRLHWPDTMRLLLTGYADINAVMGAINKGEIYRYIAKPWDDNDIFLVVRGALQHHVLELEQKRLQALVQLQNEELKAMNDSLEVRVHTRTQELRQANERMRNNFITSIKVFTSLIELRHANLAGHARRVADMARKIATHMGLDAKQGQEIFVAGLLHEVGKVGFADELLSTPVVMLNTRQLEVFRTYPGIAETILMPLEELKGAVEIIKSHLERFDGGGYPHQLVGERIPLGSRILSVASEFDSLQLGLIGQRKLDARQAQEVIVQGSGRRFDPAVVDAFVVLRGGKSREQLRNEKHVERSVSSRDLVPGMVLSRDMITPSGLLMLTAGHVLDDMVIRKIIDFERSSELKLAAEVWQDPQT
ncbi:HD domain-containing phosphohydrolase [Rhodoferax sp.]|uniref:HD domain-containing phosphohydrolase n=1 Tax=Rhodoferax sp. TaxID=50421 RepID=UPI00263921EF|nr:HD domain-containing phosphohydrolase [Rhodoferax sp.]MDD2808836.1 response regulator [Rhodoferax sp.]MDD4942451.1 response regulator [Rhodoferax sp.]